MQLASPRRGGDFFARWRLMVLFGLSCKALLLSCLYCSWRLPGAGVTFFAAAKKVTKESSF
jgi:hypothetical protein